MEQQKQQIESIFAAAIEVEDLASRQRLVERACGNDAKLRQRVDELLANHASAGSFLDSPAPPVRDLLAGVADGTMSQHQSEALSAMRAGTVIGRYRLLERIGEGGMGVVFMAQQQEPVRRKVALKVIKTGMDTGQVVARFSAERQALALMDHPNIARVLDGGSTEQGRPYFVMELVQGVPITEYCDTNQLSARQRLELFIPVCQAVQHAHQKGVIHRDLKPSNVLVTLADGVPVPKVIDFGVAKAIGQDLTDQTLFTQFAQMVGTPLYMSPEQAAGGVDVDTRSDVYSLGVLLYELLTGTTPFDRQRLGQAAYDEIRRIIREEEPPKPSTRISGLDAQTLVTVSAQRKIDTRRLGQMIRGELDWIVMKALEKDRGRRYESASGLARDVKRYLTDEAVQACPPSVMYRMRKFARRNKGFMVAASLILMTLLGGIAGTSWQAMRATTERNRKQSALDAKTAALKSEAAARNQAMAALRSLMDQLTTERTPTDGDRDFMRTILVHYEAFAAVTGDTAEGRAIRAEGHLGVGELRVQLGELDDGRASLQHAVSLLHALVNDYPNVPLYRQLLAHGYFCLGDLALHCSKPADAIAALGRTIEIETLLVGQSPDDLEYRYKLAVGHFSLALAMIHLKKHIQALSELRTAIAIQEKLVGQFPKSSRSRSAYAMSLALLAETMVEVNLSMEGEAECRTALAVLKVLHRDYPADKDYRYNLAIGHRSLGILLERLGDAAGAAAEFRDTLRHIRILAARFPGDSGYSRELGDTHNKLGLALDHLGEMAAAATEFRRAVEIAEGMVAEFPKDLTFAVHLGGYYCNAGSKGDGGLEENLAWFQKAIDTLKPIAAAEPDLQYAREFLRNSYMCRASAFAGAGRFAEAVEDWGRAIEVDSQRPRLRELRANCAEFQQRIEARRTLRETQGADHPKTLAATRALARDLEQAQLLHLAVPLLEEDLAALKRAHGEDHPDTIDLTTDLGFTSWNLDRFKQAIPFYEEALRHLEIKPGKDDPQTVQTLGNLGVNYRDDGQLEKAIPMLEEALERQRKIPDAPARVEWLVEALADAHERAGAYAKAEPLRRESVDLARQARGPVEIPLDRLGYNLLQQKNYLAAEAELKECLSIVERRKRESWITFAVSSLLGEALMNQGKYADAEPLLINGYRGMCKHLLQIPDRVRTARTARTVGAIERLVQFYDRQGNAEKADEWRRRLEARKPRLEEPGKVGPIQGRPITGGLIESIDNKARKSR